MTDGMIRIGIVGAGSNTKARHIPGLKAIEGVELVSVCNSTRTSSEQVAREFGIPHVYDSWIELVGAGDTNAIVIGTWPYLHCPVTLAALGADKHVLCEARMAMNAAEAHAMRDAAQMSPHLVAQVVPSPYTLRADRTIQRLLAEGYLGEVLAVEVRDLGGFLDPQAPLHWRQNMDLSGYNTMTLGIWYEAVMRWVGEATRVLALGKVFTPLRQDAEGILRAVRIPEHLDVIADLTCGAQLHMQISKAIGPAQPPEAWLYGSQGTLRFSEDKLYGAQRGDTQLHELAIPPEEAQGWRVEQEFVDAIRGRGKITHTTFTDGVKYMEFTEAVTLSQQTGEAIALPL